MKKVTLKINWIHLILVLFFLHLTAFSQNQLSVPFPAGFIGTKGTNSQQANTIKAYATLGIAKTFFMQNSASATAYTLQGNDVPGTLRLQLNSGQLIDIPGAIVWKDKTGTVDYLGFIPDASFSSVSFSYGASSTYTIYGTGTISNIGLGMIGKSTSEFVDGASITGNASGFASDLNDYLATTNLVANKPAGPVVVTALTTLDTTPTVTGTVTLASGESLSIDFNNVLYTTTNGLSIVSGSWSLTIPSALAIGTYSVTAKITNSAGYTLNDATSNELIIYQAGGPPTVESSYGTGAPNSITVYGNVTSDSGSSVTERGFVYSLTSNPTTSNTKVVSGSGTGIFSQLISGLSSNTTYYVRAYAINAGGTAYGSELSLGTCGGDIIGSGYGKNPNSIAGTDDNWKVVALPQGYTYTETLPYNAYVPLTSDLYNLNVYNTGYTVSGKTYYWIAPKTNAKELLGGGVYYNWIVQQTFTVAQSGFYDLNFSGAGDNAISFYINGVIDTTNPVLPTITGGTQIGSKHNSFTALGTFTGVTYLNAGVNTASMVMEDYGGDTVALISGSTFTCNNTYVNIVPVISTVTDATIVEGTTPSPIAFTVSDLETPLNNLTVTATSSNTALIPNANIVFAGATGSRTITTTPVSGETGSATITITLDDNAGGVVTRSFVVTLDELALNKYGQYVSDPLEVIDMYGGKGTGKGFNKSGKKIDKPLPPLKEVGDAYQGGTIFYLSALGSDRVQHGLIRTGILTTNVNYNNTLATTIPNANTSALNGYSNWRLPNYNEAVKICQTGGISSGTWLMSSTVTSYASTNIEVVYKSGCSNSNLNKTTTDILVILVRSF